jgi:hypothetical protein
MRTSASGSTGLKKPESLSYPGMFLVLLLDLLVPHRRVGQPRYKGSNWSAVFAEGVCK